VAAEEFVERPMLDKADTTGRERREAVVHGFEMQAQEIRDVARNVEGEDCLR
jgi:hypothetical protein